MRYILDGNAIAAKAFFGTHYKKPTFSASLFTSALLASLEKIFKVIAGDPEAYIIFCIDSHSWRNDHIKNYKGKETDDRTPEEKLMYRKYIEVFSDLTVDMKSQMPIYVVQRKGMEADDLLAYFTKNREPGEKVVLVTSDKDMKQLIRKDEVMYYNFSEERMVEEDPEYALHFLLCHGDESDNIPAINRSDDGKIEFRFGEKTIDATYKKDQFNKMNISEMFLIELSASKKIPLSEFTETLYKRYKRNKFLIDLYEAPWNKDGTKIRVKALGTPVTGLDFWAYWGGGASPELAGILNMFSTNLRGEIG